MRNRLVGLALLLVATTNGVAAGSPGAHTDAELLNAAVTACRQMDDARRPGNCYLLFGLVDIESKNSGGARVHIEEAARRFETAGDPVAAWKALWMLGEYERRFGHRPDLKLAVLEKALAVIERAKTPHAPFAVDGLGELQDILKEFPRASSSLESVFLQLFEAVSRDGYAAALLDLGELEKAERQLGLASQLAGPFGGMLDRSIARNFGYLRRRQWRLDEATESYRQALAAPKIRLPFTVDDRREGDVAAMDALSEIEMLGGRTEEALGWNERALVRARAAGERGAEVSLLRHRATILERGGHFAAAEQIYADAFSIAEANGDVKGQATLLSARALMYMDRGRFGAAIMDSEKSLELLATFDDPLLESALLTNLAGMYFKLGAHGSAASALEKARAVNGKDGSGLIDALLDVSVAVQMGTPVDLDRALEHFLQRPEVRGMENMPQLAALLRATAGPNPAAGLQAVDRSRPPLEGAEAQLLEIVASLNQGRFSAARKGAAQALALSPNAELRAMLLAITALTYAAEGQWELCLDYGTRASDAFDSALDMVLVDDLLSGFLGDRRALFDMLIEAFVLTGRGEEAFDVAERVRARAFLQLVGSRRIRPRSSGGSRIAREAESLRTQIAQWQQQARLAPSKQLYEDLRGARRRFEGLRTRVKSSDPEYAAITSIEAAPLETIRVELPPATTLISYFVSLGKVHAWVLDHETMEYVQLSVDDAWLERATCAARRFGQGGRGARVRDASCDAATVDEMYERLFAPLRKHLHNPRLIIVPHGTLHYLPFGAFLDARTERYLIEDYTITYAPSASSILYLRDKETPVNGKALVIGAPAGVLPELPGARAEAMIVATELHSVPILGTAAREGLLYQLQGAVDLVHIAAHGFYEPDTPLFSRIALAAGDDHDGDLQVHEILSDLDLTGVNLVVLSACQTGIGKGSAGDEIVGLTRALLYAGTPGVISTLWDIGDHAAAELMSHFYCRLVSGDSAADALRHAQLQLLRGDYPDPSQWAAFTLSGDPEGRWNPSDAVITSGN